MSASSTMDLTKGSIWKNILAFSVPMLLSSLVQQLYNTVDLIFVGNMIGTSASAAVGASTLLITCLVGFFSGMSVGSGVTIAKAFGAGDEKQLSKAIHCTVAFCIAGGIALMAAGYLISPLALALMRTPENLRSPALGYMRIYFISFPAILAYNLGSGVMRALGDSRSPLVAQFWGGLTNVAADYILIRVMQNGVNGVAFASLFSQTVASLIVFRKMTKLNDAYALRMKKVAFDGPLLKEMLRIGIPTGLQSMMVTLSNLIIQFNINSLGETSIAAFVSYFKAEMPVYLPQVAFGQAIMTYVGQNLGAGRMDRIKDGIRTTSILSVFITISTCAFLLVYGQGLFRIFSKDMDVITTGQRIIAVSFPFYFMYCFVEIYSGALRGLGSAKAPALITLVSCCVLRPLILCILVPFWPNVQCIATVYPITWTTSAIGLYVAFRKRFRVMSELMSGSKHE